MQTRFPRVSIVHGVSAGIKLPLALLLVIGTALLPRRPDAIYFWPAGLIGILFLLARVPLLFAAKRLLFVEFFILGFGILALLNPAGQPIFLSALIKSNLCVLAMLILAWTTPFHEILNVLRKWRAPDIMLSTLALMHRYLPVLVEESRRMQRARASRTFSPKQRLAWDNVTLIIGQLFVRGAERAERIYLAMCARGWK